MRMSKRVLVALAAVMALAACGDDDDDLADGTSEVASSVQTTPETTSPATTSPSMTAPATTSPVSTAPPTTAPETTEAPQPPTEAELAEAALLTLDDLPPGYTASPGDPDDVDEADEARLDAIAECAAVDRSLIGDEVLGDTEAESDDFQSPEEMFTFEQSLGFAADEETAIAAITAMGSDALPDCYEQALTESFANESGNADPSESLPPGLTLTDLVMERIDTSSQFAPDEVVHYYVTVAFDFDGQPLELYLDLVFARQGRMLSQLEFDGEGVPFPPDEVDEIVAAALEKMALSGTT